MTFRLRSTNETSEIRRWITNNAKNSSKFQFLLFSNDFLLLVRSSQINTSNILCVRRCSLSLLVIVVTTFAHRSFKKNFVSNNDLFQNIVSFIAFFMLCLIRITYFSICSRQIRNDYTTKSRQLLFNFFRSIFFHVLLWRFFFNFIINMTFVNMEIWFDDWFNFDRVMQCINSFRNSSNIKIKSIILHVYLIFHVTEFSERMTQFSLIKDV
jgi:hypothetical protein